MTAALVAEHIFRLKWKIHEKLPQSDDDSELTFKSKCTMD